MGSWGAKKGNGLDTFVLPFAKMFLQNLKPFLSELKNPTKSIVTGDSSTGIFLTVIKWKIEARNWKNVAMLILQLNLAFSSSLWVKLLSSHRSQYFILLMLNRSGFSLPPKNLVSKIFSTWELGLNNVHIVQDKSLFIVTLLIREAFSKDREWIY